MTPAETLQAAADKLRAAATATMPAPWSATRWHSDTCGTDCEDPSCFMLIVSTPGGILGDADVDRDGVFAVERNANEQGEHDAEFIALMHPGVGAALADWLDEAARFADLYIGITLTTTGKPPAEADYDSLTRHALAVARQLLGTTNEAAP